MDNDIINEQIAYYCARAQEYDESVLRIGRYASSVQTILPPLERVSWVDQVLQELKPCNHILELACGTGLWTRELVSIGKTITAVDASPEMLAINQYKISDKRIHYLQADIFQWQPD